MNENHPMFKRLQEDKELLGIEIGLANQRIFSEYILHCAKKLGINKCYRCTMDVENTREMSLDHIIPWFSGKNSEEKMGLFLDINNIRLSHLKCNAAAAQAGKGKSKYVGVYWILNKRTGYTCWEANIKDTNGKSVCCGCFQNELDAAKARDLGVIKYLGGKGLMNFRENTEEYKKQVENGWGEPPKCKVCGDRHFGYGYCRKHHYQFCGGKEKRKARYDAGSG